MHRHGYFRALLAMAALVLLTLGSGGTTSAAGSGAVALACDITTNSSFSGRVARAGSPLTVRGTDERERTVIAGPNLTVIRDGNNATFASLREGDQVNVNVVPGNVNDCIASRIEATSQPAAAPVQEERGFNPLWLLPLLLLPLLALPFLLRRRPAPRPVTTERVVTPQPTRPTVTSERVVRTDAEPIVERTEAGTARDGHTTITSDSLADDEATRRPRR